MINKISISILLAVILTCTSCQKTPSNSPNHNISDQQDAPADTDKATQDLAEDETSQDLAEDETSQELAEVDDFNFAQTIPATKDDIIHTLQGEWNSKESGYNFTIKFDGDRMTIGETKAKGEQVGFDIKPGSPIEIVPNPKTFKTIRFNETDTTYTIQSLYFINYRIALSVKRMNWTGTEDEIVLTRGLTQEDLFKAEGSMPKPDLVFNTDNSKSPSDIIKSIQGTWEGRDNCNYKITIHNRDITIREGIRDKLHTKLHLSMNNPAHIELDSDILEDTNIKETVFGLYYLDDTSIVLSVYSSMWNHKYEYILRKPEYFGRFIMDKEIIPQIEGVWEDEIGERLTIKGNTIQYRDQTDTFHVKTYHFSDKESGVYHLVSESDDNQILNEFIPFRYENDELNTLKRIPGHRIERKFHRVNDE